VVGDAESRKKGRCDQAGWSLREKSIFMPVWASWRSTEGLSQMLDVELLRTWEEQNARAAAKLHVLERLADQIMLHLQRISR
jgi:hypothetical protein